MSNLDNPLARQEIRERLNRGENPDTIVFENHLGWVDEGVVRDEARKRAARNAPLRPFGESSSSESSSSGGNAIVGIFILLGIAIVAIKALFGWVAENAQTLIGFAGFIAFIAAVIMGAKYFQVDGKGVNGSTPFSRWKERKKVLALLADSFQEILSDECEHTTGTVEHVLDCCRQMEMQDVYREFLSHHEGRSPVNRQKILEDSRGRLLAKKPFKDRPDLIFLFCMAHTLANTYRPNKTWTDNPHELGVLRKGLIRETRKRGGYTLARDISHILKHI